jgi:hypothetical protein
LPYSDNPTFTKAALWTSTHHDHRSDDTRKTIQFRPVQADSRFGVSANGSLAVMSHGILPIMNHASLPDRSLIFSNQD